MLLDVRKMTCNHCVRSVTAAVQTLDPRRTSTWTWSKARSASTAASSTPKRPRRRSAQRATRSGCWSHRPGREKPMYVPGHFAESDPERISRLVDAHPLATLVAQVDGRIEAQHLPFLRLDRLAVGQRLIAHAARGNPVWRLGEPRAEVLLVFAGAEAYVSPAFYPSKDEHHRVVPTFNYAAVHLRGELSCAHDHATKLCAVGLLTKHMEAGREAPWSVSDAPPAYVDRMLDGIVALSFEIHSIEAKFKASQNKSEGDRRGVVAGLRATRAVPATEEAAEMIERGLPR